ncbi:MAG: hypothetical protein ACKO5Y_01370 [Bacteroidota bacterium]
MLDPIETYLSAVNALCPKFSEEELEYFRSGLSITELQPKHFYIHANAMQQEIGFVYQGSIIRYSSLLRKASQ